MAKYIDVDRLKSEINGANRPEINSGSEAAWLCECINKVVSSAVRSMDRSECDEQ